MDRIEIFKWANEEFGINPEYPFTNFPDYAVLRNDSSNKWFAVIMNLSCEKLGLSGLGEVDVINVKCDPILIGSLRMQAGYLPAYHMNKNNWISILMDGTVPEDDIKYLISTSFELTEKRKNWRKKNESNPK